MQDIKKRQEHNFSLFFQIHEVDSSSFAKYIRQQHNQKALML